MHSSVYFRKCAHSQQSTVEIQTESAVKAPKISVVNSQTLKRAG